MLMSLIQRSGQPAGGFRAPLLGKAAAITMDDVYVFLRLQSDGGRRALLQGVPIDDF